MEMRSSADRTTRAVIVSYPIVTICGSMRFYRQMLDAAKPKRDAPRPFFHADGGDDD